MMMITEQDAQSVVVTTETKHASIYVGALGVSVLVKPLSQRLMGAIKVYPTFKAAIDSYKSTEAKEMIRLAQEALMPAGVL